jgi:hypothetical protein
LGSGSSESVLIADFIMRANWSVRQGSLGACKASPSANIPTKMASLNTWLVVDLPLRKMMEFVSWDYYFRSLANIKFMFQTTNQISLMRMEWMYGMVQAASFLNKNRSARCKLQS